MHVTVQKENWFASKLPSKSIIYSPAMNDQMEMARCCPSKTSYRLYLSKKQAKENLQ